MGLKLGEMYWQVGADTRNFDQGMQHVDRSARQMSDSASGSFRRIAETAMGFLVAQAIPAVLNGFKSLVTGASQAYGSYERLALSLEQMAQRDVLEAATLERRTVVGQQVVELTAREIEQLEDLRLKRDTLAAQMQEESERHRQLVERYGEEGLAVATHTAKLAQMQERYGDVTGAIAALEAKSGQIVDIIARSTEVVIDENEAQQRAAQIAKELLAWQQKLTIQTPFTEEGVQNAIKTASAYGFLTEQAMALALETGSLTQEQVDQDVSLQRLIQAMADYAAGTGHSTHEVELVSLALGQVRAKGKLAGQEILQLTNAGVNVRKILSEAFGVTTQELVRMQEEGLIPANEAILAIVESFEKDFGGAAREQATTWSGLFATLSDLKKIGLRELFTGTFQAIQPYITGLVETFSNPDTIARIRAFGDALGEKVGKALEFVKDVVLSFKMGGVPGLLLALGVDIETVNMLKQAGDVISTLAGQIGVFLDKIKTGFSEGGLAGGLDVFGGIFLQLASGVGDGVKGLGDKVAEWFGGIGDRIKEWWFGAGGGQLVTDTIEGIGRWIQNVLVGFSLMSEGGRTGLLDAIGNLWRSFVDWWDTGGQQIVVDVLVALGNALTSIATGLATVGENLVNEISRYTHDLWYGLVDWWQEGGQQLAVDTLAAIGQWFTDTWNQLVASLPGWIDKIDVWVTGLFNQIVDGFVRNYPTWSEKGGEVLGTFVGKALDFLFNTLPDLIGKLAAFFSKLFAGGEGSSWGPGNPLYDAAAKIGPAILEGVMAGMEAFWNALYENAPEQVQTAMDWIEGVFRDAAAAIQWLKTLPEKGKALIQGALDGIAAMPETVKTALRNFIRDNIEKVKDWSSVLVQAGKDLVAGLKQGLIDAGERFKSWIIAWLKSILPKPILDFLGIHSPSLLFAWIGEQIVAGLTQGIQNATPEAIQSVTDMIQGVMSAISSVLGAAQGLTNLQAVLDLETKLDAVFEIIEQVMERTKEIASQYATPAGQELLERLAALGGTMQSAFGVFQSALNAAVQMVQATVEPGALTNADAIFDFVKRMIPEIVDLLSDIADQFTAEQLVQLGRVAELAAMIQGALASWKAAADTVHDIAAYMIQQIGGGAGSQLWTLAEQMFGLIRKLATVVDMIGEDDLLAASAAGEKIMDALSPWKSAIDAINQIAEYTYQQIGGGPGQPLNDLANQVFGLVRKLATVADLIGPDTLALASDAGAKIVAALAPWKAAIAAVAAIANEYEYVQIGGGDESKLALLAGQLFGLVRKIATIAQQLGTSTVTYAAEMAGLMVQALTPWKAAIDTATAIAAYLPQGLDYQMEQLGEFMGAAAQAMASIATSIGVDTLALAAKVGKQFRAALEPWELAIKVANEMRAFRYTEDLVEKFHKFAGQWAAIIEDLLEVVDILDEEGLALVEAFGQAIGALAGGLGAALDVALRIPDEWTVNAAVWDAFKAWVMETFRAFYDWLSAWSTDSEGNGIPAGDDEINLVGAFGTALSSLMVGLRSAMDVVASLPTTWNINIEVWNSFIAWVQGVFAEFYNWVTTELAVVVTPEPGGDPGGTGDPTSSMGLVAAFGSALSSLMGGLASALQFILSFPDQASFPTEAVWNNFRDWVLLVFQQFQTWVIETFHPEDPNLFGPVASFGQAMQAVFGGLVAALEFFQGIVGWVGMGSTFQQRLATFLTEVKARFLEIATFVSTELDGDVLASVSAFGDALSGLTSGLSDALALFQDLADTDPAVFTAEHDFRVRVQALMRSIHDVINAFWTYITNENGQLWIPVADDLFDKFDRMLRVMRDALNLFVDLNANNLPTPNDLQTFISLVVQLFQNLTGSILNAGTQAGSGVSAIEGAISGGLTTLGGYIQDFYDMGLNFAHALRDGILAGLGDVSAAAGQLGDAAAGGTGDALQISSPSKVAMRLGGFFVEGFASSLLEGRQTIASAMGSLFGSRDFAFDNVRIDTTRTIRVEFSGSAGGGVPLTPGQFDALKSDLVWALQRGV